VNCSLVELFFLPLQKIFFHIHNQDLLIGGGQSNNRILFSIQKFQDLETKIYTIRVIKVTI
jgi:hypothetical protein